MDKHCLVLPFHIMTEEDFLQIHKKIKTKVKNSKNKQ